MAKFRIIIADLLSLAVFIPVLLFYKCPFKALFGFSCAGCGLTRSMLCAIRLDFISAFRYHPLFGIVIVELTYLFFREHLPQRFRAASTTEMIITAVTALLFLIVYIFRLHYGILPT